MTVYGQFCPVAKAMEVLDERWTLLVVRELLAGSSHFNELRRGVPKMSPALLSKRLRSLVRAGVVRRRDADNRVQYELTQCGRELAGVVESLGAWGVRWIGELGEGDLDPHLLLWDLRRRLDLDAMPRSRTVISFVFDDVASQAARWWLMVAGDNADICDYDPGFDVTVTVTTSLRTMTRIWRGDLEWQQALGARAVVLSGDRAARRALPGWLRPGAFAGVPRPVAG
ncbi:winged helix-turn-helix transcriptional regulator [Nakamurella lactea]|uniref:winged helix-turn-helix transcriptional regulator n=1 Tax=Nakamurella lactea TaxID=459515 RepID=UPI0004219C83|nr:helix-turn-helix domain-containing protein [Nakamurella lactea]